MALGIRQDHHPRPSLHRHHPLHPLRHLHQFSLVPPHHESTFTAGRLLFLATAIAYFAFGGISIGLAYLRDESKLEPVDGWYSTLASAPAGWLPFGVGRVKEYKVPGIQKKEGVLALVGLSVLL